MRFESRSCRPLRVMAAACAACLFVVLAACGQKGPLYVPGHSKDTPWPIMPTPPASGNGAPQACGATPATPVGSSGGVDGAAVNGGASDTGANNPTSGQAACPATSPATPAPSTK